MLRSSFRNMAGRLDLQSESTTESPRVSSSAEHGGSHHSLGGHMSLAMTSVTGVLYSTSPRGFLGDLLLSPTSNSRLYQDPLIDTSNHFLLSCSEPSEVLLQFSRISQLSLLRKALETSSAAPTRAAGERAALQKTAFP